MSQCKAATSAGNRCRNNAPENANYCTVHSRLNVRNQIKHAMRGAAAGGLATGNSIGILVAAAAGALSGICKTPVWRKKRIFVSFDFDQDKFLKHALIAQTALADSPFEIVDASLKEAAPDKHWVARAKKLIQSSDLVLVLLGRHTHRAPGVLTEVALAKEMNVPIIQLIGYPKIRCRPISGAGRAHKWTWKNLERLFGVTSAGARATTRFLPEYLTSVVNHPSCLKFVLDIASYMRLHVIQRI